MGLTFLAGKSISQSKEIRLRKQSNFSAISELLVNAKRTDGMTSATRSSTPFANLF